MKIGIVILAGGKGERFHGKKTRFRVSWKTSVETCI